MYHHHARTTLSILEALMTFSPDDFAIAIQTAEETMRESAVLSKDFVKKKEVPGYKLEPIINTL